MKCMFYCCRWKIVIHGCIHVDGYSRRIVCLGARDSNRADTVLELFTSAINHLGVFLCVSVLIEEGKMSV